MRDYGAGPDDHADGAPVEYCPLCGDPLPLDLRCSCAGTDLDPTAPENQLAHNLVFTYPRGNTRTYRRKADPK